MNYKTGGLKTTKCVLSPCWRLEAWSQRAGRALAFLSMDMHLSSVATRHHLWVCASVPKLPSLCMVPGGHGGKCEGQLFNPAHGCTEIPTTMLIWKVSLLGFCWVSLLMVLCESLGFLSDLCWNLLYVQQWGIYLYDGEKNKQGYKNKIKVLQYGNCFCNTIT